MSETATSRLLALLEPQSSESPELSHSPTWPERPEAFGPRDLEAMLSSRLSVQVGDSIAQVEEILNRHHLAYAAVLDGREPVGLCSRRSIATLFSHPYGRSLFSQRPVSTLARSGFTLAALNEPIADVLARLASRPAKAFEDDVIVVNAAGEFVGMVEARVLLQLQHRFFATAIAEVGAQRDIAARQMRQVEYELDLAHRVQAALMPVREQQLLKPELPMGDGHWALVPAFVGAQQLSGDFFHVIDLDEAHVGILLCDVMGHGVASALVVSLLRALVESNQKDAYAPDAYLAGLNTALCRALGERVHMFATAAYLVLNCRNGDLRLASAGHPSPLLLHGASIQTLAPPGGSPLGMFRESNYDTLELRLGVGDELLLYTDGLVEQTDHAGRLVGEAGLHAMLAQLRRNGCASLPEALLQSLRAQSRQDQFTDDVCILHIHHSAPGPAPMMPAHTANKAFAGSLQGVAKARKWTQARLQQWGVSRALEQPFLLAVSELATNLVKHGPCFGGAEFTVELQVDDSQVQLDLSSPGGSFRDMAELLDHASDLDKLDPLATSGRGLALVLAAFPDLAYQPATGSAGGERFRLRAASGQA